MRKNDRETFVTGPKINQEPEEWNKPLPQFRKDLRIMRGPDEPDGSPSYNLYDPVKGKYFRLTWYEARVFEVARPGMTLKKLASALERRTAMKVSPQDLQGFFWDAQQNNLLDSPRQSQDLTREHEAKQMNPIIWVLFHYLYIRIPLFRPDKFLERTLPYVTPLASKAAFVIYALITISGFILLMDQFGEFINTFTYFFNWEGIIVYMAVIFATKIFHELGHAYTAKYYGVHVPVMGIALIILWPVLFTDATDAWKLTKRGQRFAISVAGIVVELVIAGLATWGWILSEPGLFQSACFLLASVTWISSLLINLNPCMRFDGYYLLSDLWGIDNLQTRAFAVARWKLRQIFLGLDMPPPEEVSRKRVIGMVIYSVATWIYRLTLYISIALIVYFKFTKVLGVILFVLEIIIFIVIPAYTEVVETLKLKKFIKLNARFIITNVVILLALGWFVLPLPHTFYFSAVTTPVEHQTAYVPYSSRIEKIFVKKGSIVKEGDPLVQLYSYKLNEEIEATKASIDVTAREMAVMSISREGIAELAGKREELKALQARLQGLLARRRSLTVRSTVSGVVYEWDNNLRENQSLVQDFELGRVAPLDQLKVIAYVPEDQVSDINTGEKVKFLVSRTLEKIPGTIRTIRTGRDLVLEYPQMASVYGGDLPTKQKASDSNKLYLVHSYYVIDVTLDEDESNLKIGQLGYVEASGPWQSKLLELVRLVIRVIWRESGV